MTDVGYIAYTLTIDMYFFNINVSLKLMATTGTHPKMHNSKIQKCLVLLNMSVLLIVIYLACLIFIYEEKLIMFDATGAMESILLLIHAASKILTLYFKHSEIKDLLEQFDQFWKIEEIEYEEEKAESLQFLKYIKSILYYYMGLAGLPLIAFCFRPFLLRQRVFAFNSYVPESVPYSFLFLLEDYAVLIVYVVIISFDLLFATSVVLTKVQFQLLNQEIKRVVESTSGGDESLVRMKWKKCVDHHNFLLGFIKKINKTLSNVVLIYFGLLIFSICVELFMISNRKSVKELVKCVVYLATLANQFVVFYCIPGQLLTSEAEEIYKCAYDSQWYKTLSSSTKCTINMISMRGQKKVYITAGDFVNLGMESCLSTYKTIFSYYMFLMTMQGKTEEE